MYKLLMCVGHFPEQMRESNSLFHFSLILCISDITTLTWMFPKAKITMLRHRNGFLSVSEKPSLGP